MTTFMAMNHWATTMIIQTKASLGALLTSASTTPPDRTLYEGLGCDADGNVLPADAPPPPWLDPEPTNWNPYDSRNEFEVANFLYKKCQMPQAKINQLMNLWAASLLKHDDNPPFADNTDLENVIDATTVGDIPWQSFSSPRLVAHHIIGNADIAEEFDKVPYREFVHVDGEEQPRRRYGNFMSANWPWEQADIIAEDEKMHGAMFGPLVVGSDKTTVSVATGQNEYYPLYMSLGNVHNNVRRAHRDALVLIGFLSIPKSNRVHKKTKQFLKFRQQLFHSSLSAIFDCLRPYMAEQYDVVRCGDGYYRRVVYGLGPYIADYPEQVLAACIVQGWCSFCDAHRSNLGPGADRRTQAVTEALIDALDPRVLWDEYGIVHDIIPFTNDFPRADIHELLSGDLLHQVIKGAFKDHLVTWVGEYLTLQHGEARAKELLDEIDRRIASTPYFPGLRRFYEGREFKQWTGDDSKALMKVYLPAINGIVPDDMVRALAAFMEVCYLLRRSILDDTDLIAIETALERFRHHRQIFQDSGVRPTGFSLPRMHALDHYIRHIQQFGAPNGLCSSMTEAKHIKAVKEPWRRSNRHRPLGQMLLTNQRLDKLAASRRDFERRGMLEGDSLSAALAELAADDPPAMGEPIAAEAQGELDDEEPVLAQDEERDDEEDDVVDGPTVHGFVELARCPVRGLPNTLQALSEHIGQPALPSLLRRFLFDQQNPQSDVPGDEVSLRECPVINSRSRVRVFPSAVATFYAPSDVSGVGGMRRERIRAVSSWYNGPGRYDCVFVGTDPSQQGMRSMHAARVRLLFSFRQDDTTYPCALVEWFEAVEDEPDGCTGMWVVEPDLYADNSRHTSVIHLDSVLRLAHLIPVYGEDFLPINFDAVHSLDAFRSYFVNKFADHNAHEIAF
ncbi:uncharacterized protein B0H18DRAFT_1107822 [Fomitopsis serialis]|uniref:uncharacterized protein n=1 Tax=Fomitopsis serialis TaxID=139415 RepID=UPI0020084362|nr:uncharacterized protein B0H18DRAFT_1107822 [Neoantrodia serialis]KAH9915818.1 hypothetical protein B0H18DRAFT_1107822 [Neoantrodia serialis]